MQGQGRAMSTKYLIFKVGKLKRGHPAENKTLHQCSPLKPAIPPVMTAEYLTPLQLSDPSGQSWALTSWALALRNKEF